MLAEVLIPMNILKVTGMVGEIAVKTKRSLISISANGLRICEVRQTINLNICKPLRGVSCIYAVRHSCFNYDKIR